MKKILHAALITLASILLFSCKSTDVPEEPQEKTEPVVQEVKEPETPAPEDDEFSRSTQEVSITVEEFNADKKAILDIIKELSYVMQDRDYNKWLTYIEPESVTYWSNPNNLKQASKRLPVKGMKLANLLQHHILHIRLFYLFQILFRLLLLFYHHQYLLNILK